MQQCEVVYRMLNKDPEQDYIRRPESVKDYFPGRKQGRDGDMEYVFFQDKHYLCIKINNTWIKFEGVKV
jgi:hypothetical protein